MNGILLLALGDDHYVKMAIACAASIKKSSSIPIALIHSHGNLDGLSQRKLDLFDIKIPIVNGSQDHVRDAMAIKTRLLIYTPFINTLYLDVDTILIPPHNIRQIFEDLKNDSFQTNGFVEEDNPYPAWGDLQKIKRTYSLANYRKCNTSMIWFKKDRVAKKIFDIAGRAFSDKNEFNEFRGVKADELCFNVAIARTCHPVKNYRPVFIHFMYEHRSKEYVVDNFKLFSVTGTKVPDPRMVIAYNDYVKFYFDYHGFGDSQDYFYRPKINYGPMPTYVFWHIATMGNFEEVIQEQMGLIVMSGLISKAKKVYIGVVGPGLEAVKKVIAGHKKFQIITHRHSVTEYEFPTLKYLQEMAQNSKPFYAVYVHTKGVSDSRGAHWRDFLNYFNITKWKDCVKKIKMGYDVVGVKWMEENHAFPRHFSGNFWHTTSEYIKRLPQIDSLDRSDRFQAEFWIGMGNPRFFSFSQLMIDHFNKPEFK